MSTFYRCIDQSCEGGTFTRCNSSIFRKPAPFVYSEGSIGIARPRDFPMANPMWSFSDCNYDSDDDYGPIDPYIGKPCVDEVALDLYINRILHNTTSKEYNPDAFELRTQEDVELEGLRLSKQRPSTATTSPDKQGWKKKSRRLRRESKKEKKQVGQGEYIEPHRFTLPKETLRGTSPEGVEMICMPLSVYRDAVAAEIDSRARNIYYYFSREARHYDDIKVNAMKDSFFWHEKTKKLEKLLELKDFEIITLKEQCATYMLAFEEDKEQKRRRRDVKKQRRKARRSSTNENTGGDRPINDENLDPSIQI